MRSPAAQKRTTRMSSARQKRIERRTATRYSIGIKAEDTPPSPASPLLPLLIGLFSDAMALAKRIERAISVETAAVHPTPHTSKPCDGVSAIRAAEIAAEKSMRVGVAASMGRDIERQHAERFTVGAAREGSDSVALPLGNLKPAPFSLTPGARSIEVPIVPIKLVDRPRRSEDPRLAKANDDACPVAAAPEPTIAKTKRTRKSPVGAQARAAVLPTKADVAVPSAPLARGTRIDLNRVPSAMERQAEDWHRATEAPIVEAAPVADDGKAWCDGCGARLPLFFADDCISTRCSLRAVRS